VYFGRRARLSGDGALCDLAPSVLHLMGLPQPGEMSGHNLIELG
jgi:2,3-bisphosphoglycerate-independent phosphoglycerate mutase